jgi:MICOS complex subunit MIC19
MKKQGLHTEKEGARLSSITLEGDIKELQEKYVGVKDLKEDVDAKNAKDELIKCLQSNEGRALDCWWEVKQFKEKVAKLEHEFVLKHQ